MALVQLSLTNVFTFISIMTPFLLIFFFTLSAIFTGSVIKGLLYMLGIVITTTINKLVQNTLKVEQDKESSPFCNILPFPFTNQYDNQIYSSPHLSSCILGYTLSYIIYPMMLLKYTVNPAAIISLFGLSVINSISEYVNKCANLSSIFLGYLIGGIIGMFWYFIVLNGSNDKNLVYFSEIISNNIMCNKPSEQYFKCEYYKDGVKIDQDKLDDIFK